MAPHQSTATFIQKELLHLLPYHRQAEKRTSLLTLDELIDDYRKMATLSAAELDFLLMAYRFEHPFQKFLKVFTDKQIRPEELIDLWRMAFASLLTREETNIPQLTHAWVETSKKIFGPFTSGVTNAFCRKVLREKETILKDIEGNPDLILGPSLAKRWATAPQLRSRFSKKVLERPPSGISVLSKGSDGKLAFNTVRSAEFSPGTHLAMSRGSYLWIEEISQHITKHFTGKSIKVLDMCAAPGGKLIGTLIAHESANAIAVDSKYKRIERLKENIKNWKLENRVDCVLYDWTQNNNETLKKEKFSTLFDVIIADLPCTGLGTLASRPDLLHKNWSNPEDQLLDLQKKILEEALPLLSPGGLLFVSICSSDPSELQHLSEILKKKTNFCAEVGPDNSEEISGWVMIRE